jgi:hypothetical protein
MDDAARHPDVFGPHLFDRGGGGGEGGSNPAGARGCLFGGWRMWAFDDEAAHQRAPAEGVAALGLLIVALCIIAWWFIAR